MLKKIIIILATCCSALAFGQIAPVSSRTTFRPPYSAQVSEWGDKITLTLLLRDLSVTNGRVFVRMKLESHAITAETLPMSGSQAFQLDGGVPLQISGNDLRELFKPENLVFTGTTREQFVRNGSRLPQGQYTLWFEVYEWDTRRKVSASEGFAMISLHDIDPPILDVPQNNSLVFAETPQSIMFSWTPRHQQAISSGFRGIYDFELVQIPMHYTGDLQLLFGLTQKYSERTLFQTQFRYSDFDEELEKNREYAFRVRVRSADENDDAFQFKNNGYSEIFRFRYSERCEKPKGLDGSAENSYRANVSWDVDDFKNRYLVSYRRAGGDELSWFTKTTDFSSLLLDDLSPNQTYEVKVRMLCEFLNSEDSEPILITTPELFNDTTLRCGISFVPSDSCVEPLETLTVQDVFVSSGTTIHLQEVSGSNGVFSGKGYIRMPLFNLIKVNVVFDNISINRCFEHTEGLIRVVYDEKNNLFFDLDAYFEGGNFVYDKQTGDDCDAMISVDFAVDQKTVTVLANGDIQIGTGASSQVISQDDLPTTVKDKNGKISEITPTGQVNVLAQTSSDKSKPLSKDTTQTLGTVAFSKHPDRVMAFDEWQEGYGKSVLIRRHYETFNETFIPYQLIEANQSGMVRAVLTSKTDSLPTEKIIFKNGKNTVFQSKMVAQDTFDVSLVGSNDGDLQVVSAVYVKDSTEFVLGKLLVPAFKKQLHHIKIIPAFESPFDIENLKTDLTQAFKPYLIDLDIRLDDAFTTTGWDLNDNGVLDVVGSGWVSTLTDEMREINKLYKAEREVDNETVYLFLFENGPSNKDGISIAGDMPRGSQFGYLFLEASEMLAKTAAHEIAHGLFKLKHTFDNDYQIPKGSTSNLMDYNDGTDLAFWQWLQLQDPPTVWGIFESDGDAMTQQNKLIAILQQIRLSIVDKVSANIHLQKNLLLRTSASFAAFNSFPYQSIAMKSSQDIKTMRVTKDDVLMTVRHVGSDAYYDLMIGALTITLRSEIDQRMLYRYLTNTGNSILFVNGYRFFERSQTDNAIAKNDRYNYWGNMDNAFVSRLKSSNVYYADGHMSIGTSNHLTPTNFYCSAKLTIDGMPKNLAEAALYFTDKVIALLPLMGLATAAISVGCNASLFIQHGFVYNTLNTIPNVEGFMVRQNAGRSAGNKLAGQLRRDGFKVGDTLDIVCHSMGFAYALGMIETLKTSIPHIRLGGFYIIAPENPSSGKVELHNFMQVWHYGSDEATSPTYHQDGMAPQRPIQGIETQRVYIPDHVTKGFICSHSIENYLWIFAKPANDKGYVMERK